MTIGIVERLAAAMTALLLGTCAATAGADMVGTGAAKHLMLGAADAGDAHPTALAATDVDGDGTPDLVVAYTGPSGSFLVVHPGDPAALYPAPDGDATRATTAAPFKSARRLVDLPMPVDALFAHDLDADGVKELLGHGVSGATLVVERGANGSLGSVRMLAGAVFDRARAAEVATALPSSDGRAASSTAGAVATTDIRALPPVVHQYVGGSTTPVGGYRRPPDAPTVPSRPRLLEPPADAFATLSMRLNRDAIPDLVVLRSGAAAPEVILSDSVQTFTVTTTKDTASSCTPKACSLRAAILAANATPDADTIAFAIPTKDSGFDSATDTWRIQPHSDLPLITQPVTIDATTQPGFSGQPVIELDGSHTPAGTSGFDLEASNVVIRGFVVNGFPPLVANGERFCGCGIVINVPLGGNCIVEGNYIGTDVTGTQSRANGLAGIGLAGGTNNLIGGTTANARNVVSGNADAQFTFHIGIGSFIDGADATTIAGNYIGVDRSGFTALENKFGILLNTANNVVGGSDPGSGNVVAGNTLDGIQINLGSSTGNKIIGNHIGTNAAGTARFASASGTGITVFDASGTTIGMPGAGNLVAGNSGGVFVGAVTTVRAVDMTVIQGNTIGLDALGRSLPNLGDGIRLDNVFASTVGGTAQGEGNVIAHNTNAGVEILFRTDVCGSCSGTYRANDDRILSNSIFANNGLGIDLSTSSFGDGVTPNDANDSDTGSNDLLNFPVLTSASSTSSTSQVHAQALTCGPACTQPYTLQFFASSACDPAGNGEGQFFLGQASRSADGNPVSVDLAVPIPNGYFVTATATDSLNNTSEFSNCVQALGGPQPTVSPTPTVQPTASATASPTPTPSPDNAAGRKCRGAIVTASAALVQAEAKVEGACAGKIVSGKLPHGTTCRTEPKTAAAIAKAESKVLTTVAKACGGKDKTCGSGNDDVALADAGWQVGSCPNVEGGTCTNAITDCSGIATCLTCIGEAAIDQAIGLYYDNLVQTDPKDQTQKVLNKCQATIGRAATTFLGAKSKALAKCWQTVNAGKATGDCPAADGKAAGVIAKAESKKVAAICKACGGADKTCDGVDDLTPAAIGFAPTCPAVDPPGGAPSCFGAIASLQDIVTCVDCVTEFKVDCSTLAAVPGLAAYPPECTMSSVPSRRSFKKNIEYLGTADLQRLHDELLTFHLASYQYNMPSAPPATHLGFIIDDVTPSPSVAANGDTVDLYGYTSMAVAAVQTQAHEIDALKREVESLRAQIAASTCRSRRARTAATGQSKRARNP